MCSVVHNRGAMELGYPSMKPEQLELAMALVEGRTFLLFCLPSKQKNPALLSSTAIKAS